VPPEGSTRVLCVLRGQGEALLGEVSGAQGAEGMSERLEDPRCENCAKFDPHGDGNGDCSRNGTVVNRWGWCWSGHEPRQEKDD